MSNQIPVYMKLDRALSFYVNSSPIHYIWGFPCFRYPFFRFLYYISLSNSICLSLSLSLPVLLSCIRFFLEYSSDIFLCITAHGVLYRVYRPLLYCTVLNSELYVYVSHSYPLYTQFISCPAHGAVCLSDALFIRQRVIITVPIFQGANLFPCRRCREPNDILRVGLTVSTVQRT
jgi:hypothetical protein